MWLEKRTRASEKNFLGISRDRPVRIPNLPWELRLDSAGNESGSFSVIRCSGEPSRRRPADRPKRGTGAVVALEGEIKSDRRIEFVMDLAFGA
jgi:hypothetical protein